MSNPYQTPSEEVSKEARDAPVWHWFAASLFFLSAAVISSPGLWSGRRVSSEFRRASVCDLRSGGLSVWDPHHAGNRSMACFCCRTRFGCSLHWTDLARYLGQEKASSDDLE